ncbi:iron complex transport system permease protein [Chryseobacterium bernardetii]|uniref:Iron complex transport system permease protein n=3 Tax=Chryseobacterium TaxID=59732 RepID=A0A543EGJ9_9FLAO|nr:MULTISPECIES: iron ABC transporter permease [Chryseobacterium]MDR6370755.1 iron complex transport system permease protein [Chryseobacterium vietnamense]MDR6441761.1 iron complex transport system permease protein [Chryseobacterium bernardetii]MDR6457206.1 iron complex transport system permease protein [Chryseobacterium vietnamense]MDR6485965.1 iron complex transport system permease protein [Chryseobacterium vietnamense]TQM20712.1 iron complex transport system permease protein [Chryseobacteri
MKAQSKLYFYLIISAVLLVIIAVLSLNTGVYDFGENSPFRALWQFVKGDPGLSLSDKYVIWDVRAARIIMAILVGSMLSVSGTSLQGLFKNPLATGDLIGLTSGATLLAAIAIVLGGHFKEYLPEAVQFSLVGIAAFIGSFLSMMLVYRISTSGGKTNVVMMLLTGVAITAIGFSITGFLIYISKDEQLRDLTFWNLGSLAAATWTKNIILTVVAVIAYIILLPKGKALNAMMLGEKDAQHLGINVERLKKQIIIIVALMVGSCVAFSGTIGFVGLIVPYILRLLFKSNYTFILPLSAMCGSILLLTADTFSRSIVAPSELPIGILTALMGGPIFIAILVKFKKSL